MLNVTTVHGACPNQTNETMAVPMKVRQILSSSVSRDVMAQRLSLEGMEMGADVPHLHGVRFVWLEFTLPGDPGGRIRALGEVPPESTGAQYIRFKHLFPDYRRRVAQFLGADTRVAQAA